MRGKLKTVNEYSEHPKASLGREYYLALDIETEVPDAAHTMLGGGILSGNTIDINTHQPPMDSEYGIGIYDDPSFAVYPLKKPGDVLYQKVTVMITSGSDSGGMTLTVNLDVSNLEVLTE